MSWIAENQLSYLQRLAVNVIKCGPIPNHIAIIMDGNRRFASKLNTSRKEGHTKGFEKLAECLQWCLDLGVKEVTVYAFSIENFKRSQDEVDTLMQLAREKFRKLFEEKDKLMKEGICMRVIGNLSLLPEDIRQLIAEAMLLTKDNNKAILNVAFSYTSRDEITHSIQDIVTGLNNNEIQPEDVDEQLITECLYTNQSSCPDILVRTSGEVRLSDYLLWQISENTDIYFTNVLWPEFSIWHLLGCIFKYQRGQFYKKSFQIAPARNCATETRITQFLDSLQSRRISQLEQYAAQC